MTLTTTRRMTLQEFLSYDDGTEKRYELVDGVLVEMGAESTTNTIIAGFLFGFFLQMGLPSYRIGFKQKIEVASRYVTARDPDLIVHTEDSFAAIEQRKEACLKYGEPNPLIVIEVVSPGDETKDNYQRDYVQKPEEYADRGIGELWRIDPERKWVQIGSWMAGQYQFKTFQGDDAIVSNSFPSLNLTALQVLRAGR
jgi:Uma2 family endonuclease